MSCDQAAAEERIERYLGQDMPEEERAAFEDHFFACDECFRELQAAASVREALASAAPARRARLPEWLPIAAAVAGLGVTAALIVGKSAPPRQAAVPIGSAPAAASPAPRPVAAAAVPADLLKVDPPPYVAIVVRGVARPAWDAAMDRYARHDYAGAAALLRRLHGEDPTPAGDFYLAICELLASRDLEAEALLAGVAASRDPVYAGPALLYLGKARLRLNRVEEAREALRRLADSGGPGSQAAAELLRRLPGTGRDPGLTTPGIPGRGGARSGSRAP